MSDFSLILTAAGSIVLLLVLVMKARLHALVSLILVSIIAGLATGMNPAEITKSIEKGMGGTLGFIAVVVGLGSMFGKVMEVTGALDQIARTLLSRFGVARANWAIALTGFVCALPLFFDVAVVLLIGIAFAMVRRGGGSVVKIGIALLAGIATCQAFLIPAPGPILVASQLRADFGAVILFGLIASIPSLILAGPFFGSFISQFVEVPLKTEELNLPSEDAELPGFGLALGLIGLPLGMIALKSFLARFIDKQSAVHPWLELLGHPFTAILVACLAAFYLLGWRRGMSRDRLMDVCSAAIQPAGVIILITGAGGVFKQVLIDSGVGAALGNLLAGYGLPIVVSGFLLAAAVRIIQGSATVAMLTASGLLQPLLENANLNGSQLAALTIAIGGGAIVFSHVNDSGFWLANRYLGLTEKQTLLTWTLMETIIGVTGGLVAMLIFSLM
jgi:Gnt-I system low-affinity gluconate transporter